MFEVIWSKSTHQSIRKLPRPISKRIFEKIDALAVDPSNSDLRKLLDVTYFRLRVGDYRVILDINYESRKIMILKIGHRKNVY